MARVIVYYVHPGQGFSQANAAMWKRAQSVERLTLVDLYAEYPRFDIDIVEEQERLLAHDVIVFQFPVFWYSTPSLLKEWQDLVLEYGFAYGTGGTALEGKAMQLAITVAGPEDAYRAQGYQHYPLRDFLRPLEQTARLCHMRFLPPYALYAALKAARHGPEQIEAHAAGYGRLLERLTGHRGAFEDAAPDAVLQAADLAEAV